MRRRLRRQQRIREALLLDLGALVYELQRLGRRAPELLHAKAAEVGAVDREVRELGRSLDEGRGLRELVAAGVTGSCGSCGALLSADARFCPRCGTPTGAIAAAHLPAERPDELEGAEPAEPPADGEPEQEPRG